MVEYKKNSRKRKLVFNQPPLKKMALPNPIVIPAPFLMNQQNRAIDDIVDAPTAETIGKVSIYISREIAKGINVPGEDKALFQTHIGELKIAESKLINTSEGNGAAPAWAGALFTTLAQINTRLDQIDGRLDQIDGRFDQIDERLDLVNCRTLNSRLAFGQTIHFPIVYDNNGNPKDRLEIMTGLTFSVLNNITSHQIINPLLDYHNLPYDDQTRVDEKKEALLRYLFVQI